MRLPFEGLKVLDFTHVVAGPVITQYLADFGATVVKIETASRPDLSRSNPPFKDNKPGVDRSGFFANFNRNKCSLSIKLGHPVAADVIRRLVVWADIVVENFRPGTLQKWGMGYEDLAKIKPDIIMLSATMLGTTGPFSNYPGFGALLASLAGFSNLAGWPGGEPVQPAGGYTDSITPPLGATALIAALDYRNRTGKGQYLDLAQFEVAVHFLGAAALDYTVNGREMMRAGNRCPSAAPHGVYRCRGEDRWCALAVHTDGDWVAFGRVVGAPWCIERRFGTLLGRKRHEEELDSLVEAWTLPRQAEEVTTVLQAAGVAAAVVKNARDLHEDAQLRHRDHFAILDHPQIGVHSTDAPAFKLGRTGSIRRQPAPCLGEHTELVCRQFLAMPDEEFVRLLNAGVFE